MKAPKEIKKNCEKKNNENKANSRHKGHVQSAKKGSHRHKQREIKDFLKAENRKQQK